MLNNKKVGFIGAGAMAEALLKGLIGTGLLTADQCTLSDVSAQRLNYIATQYTASTTQDNRLLATQSDILLLAVKPQVIAKVLDEIGPHINSKTIVISIVAGICLSRLESKLCDNPVIRVMPNTPAAVGAGMAAVSLGSFATQEHGRLAMSLFEAVGESSSCCRRIDGCGDRFVW